ncbi:Nitroreductase [Carboxydocella sporoproducens DSM 16521]|uniref:Nitroreductase n=2 Tax=Carboxydocella TaxID=178898 RepID=A0A1T4RV70_9FIRM|nr:MULTISPECIES: nitroreductase family protein [Carboxydocella]AVX19986.1 Nitroreductase [Carboxydocella thermautotrophica]AVX30402.1 Nitroreductase [Carboxydocella thermautotrophica]SKA19845.1 Nitroreductase [Carboxydocella sporoproducens DSM 16521]
MEKEQIYELMRSRRSIRLYKPDPIPQETLERIIAGALWAPSGMNKQDWLVVVVTGEKKQELIRLFGEGGEYLRERLEQLFPPKMVNLTMQFFRTGGNAQAIVLVYVPREQIKISPDMNLNERHAAEHDRMGAVQSASALIQNLLLLAHAEGLGSCWLNGPLFVQEEINALLGIKDKELVAAVTLGWPDQQPPVPPRKPDRVLWYK